MLPMRCFFIVLLFAGSCNDNESKPDCQRFRNGVFFMASETEGTDDFLITRQDSIQSERNERTGEITMQKVRWIDPCRYELFRLTPYKPNPVDTGVIAAELQKSRKIPLTAEIVETGKDYYIFEAKKEGYPFVYRDTLRRAVGGFKPMGETFEGL